MGRPRGVPKLCFTETRGIGWYVNTYNPETQQSSKHRFGIRERSRRDEAEALYRTWLVKHAGQSDGRPRVVASKTNRAALGSIGHIATDLESYYQDIARKPGQPRTPGTIGHLKAQEYIAHLKLFAEYVRANIGPPGQVMASAIRLEDVEAYNRELVMDGQKQSTISHKMRMVQQILRRAVREEYGAQKMSWEWSSLDKYAGRKTDDRRLLTRDELTLILSHCGPRESAIVWTAIGCGFGPKDLSDLRWSDIDAKTYQLARSKTGIQRYGKTPPRVWAELSAYAKTLETKLDRVWQTRKGFPLVSGRSNAVSQWWTKLCRELGIEGHGGIYSLRHLGATVAGSASGASISDVRAFLGHNNTATADRYMRPIAPGDRPNVEWVREQLAKRSAD